MPLKIAQKKEEEVPTPGRTGKVNQELVALKDEMRKLSSGMVLEIETGSEKAVRGAKVLVTKASKELGSQWQHWSVGTKVFAKPLGEIRRRGRRRKEQP
jgi:TusA-related sulfurtransferase